MLRFSVLLVSLQIAATWAAAPEQDRLPEAWRAGTHYLELDPPQPTQVAKNKIEVMEVFWYGCSHCNAFEPHLERWLAVKPSYVQFVRVPIMWHSARAHARLFFTLRALGREDLHAKAFDAIYHQGNPLVGEDEDATFGLQLAFARSHGIRAEDFDRTYHSNTIDRYLEQAEAITRAYKIEGVPAMIVNGKYISDDDRAGGKKNLVEVVQYLAADEWQRANGNARAAALTR